VAAREARTQQPLCTSIACHNTSQPTPGELLVGCPCVGFEYSMIPQGAEKENSHDWKPISLEKTEDG
jgi:hypothetical protein